MWTTEQLAALKARAAEGVTEVTFPDGSKVKYADLSQMMGAIATIESQLVAQGQLNGGPCVVYGVFGRC